MILEQGGEGEAPSSTTETKTDCTGRVRGAASHCAPPGVIAPYSEVSPEPAFLPGGKSPG